MNKRPHIQKITYSKSYLAYNRKLDQSINEIERRLGLILFIVLHDKFDWKQDKVANLGGYIMEIKRPWVAGDINTEDMLAYALSNGYDIYKAVKAIPYSNKLALAKNKNKIVPGIEAYLDSAFINIFAISFKPLREHYRFYRPQFEKLYKYICQYIDEYASGYVNDRIIVESIREYGYDPIKGEKC